MTTIEINCYDIEVLQCNAEVECDSVLPFSVKTTKTIKKLTLQSGKVCLENLISSPVHVKIETCANNKCFIDKFLFQVNSNDLIIIRIKNKEATITCNNRVYYPQEKEFYNRYDFLCCNFYI